MNTVTLRYMTDSTKPLCDDPYKRVSKVAVFELQGFYRKIQRQNPLCSSDFGLPAHFSPVNDIFGPFEHFQTIV